MPRLCRGHAWRVTTSWKDASKVEEHTGRVGRLAARRAGEAELVEALPDTVQRILDLGCGDGRLVSEHDLGRPLPSLGPFDVVLSGFAIHHLPDGRKRSLFGEIHDLLRAGGVFVNLEVVQCATPELHEEFNMALEPIDVSPPA
jgi:tRNA (cmo5U34)-methyltransferase